MRLLRWMLLAAMVSGVVAFVAVAVAFVRPDCAAFPEQAAEFRGEYQLALRRSERSGPEVNSELRGQAESLVRCGRLVGRTPDELAAALGVPDERGADDDPRLHGELYYALGQDAGSVSNTEIALFMEVDRDVVVYATVEGEGRKVVDGKPVRDSK